MKVQFNTGRAYTEHGQRIVAVHTGGGIFFKDHDRRIDGYIVCHMQRMSKTEIEEIVMYAYDRGMYDYNSAIYNVDLSWEE